MENSYFCTTSQKIFGPSNIRANINRDMVKFFYVKYLNDCDNEYDGNDIFIFMKK